jgi:hypothetical protein
VSVRWVEATPRGTWLVRCAARGAVPRYPARERCAATALRHPGVDAPADLRSFLIGNRVSTARLPPFPPEQAERLLWVPWGTHAPDTALKATRGQGEGGLPNSPPEGPEGGRVDGSEAPEAQEKAPQKGPFCLAQVGFASGKQQRP